MDQPSDVQSTMDPLDRKLMEMLIRPDGRTFVENQIPAVIPVVPVANVIPAVIDIQMLQGDTAIATVPNSIPTDEVQITVLPVAQLTAAVEPTPIPEPTAAQPSILLSLPPLPAPVMQDLPAALAPPAPPAPVVQPLPPPPAPPTPIVQPVPAAPAPPAPVVQPIPAAPAPPAPPAPVVQPLPPPPSPPAPVAPPAPPLPFIPVTESFAPLPFALPAPDPDPEPTEPEAAPANTGGLYNFMNRFPLFGNRQPVPEQSNPASPEKPPKASTPPPEQAPAAPVLPSTTPDTPPRVATQSHQMVDVDDAYASKMHHVQKLAAMVREIGAWNQHHQYSPKRVTVESPENEIMYLHAVVKSGWELDRSRTKKRKILSAVTKAAQLGFDQVSSQFDQPIKMDDWYRNLHYEIHEDKTWDEYLDPIEVAATGMRPEFALIAALGFSFGESYLTQRQYLKELNNQNERNRIAREEEHAARFDARTNEALKQMEERFFKAQQQHNEGSRGSRNSKRSRRSQDSSSDESGRSGSSSGSSGEESHSSSKARRKRHKTHTTTEDAFEQFRKASTTTPAPPAELPEVPEPQVATRPATPPSPPLSVAPPASTTTAATPRRIRINPSKSSTPVRI